MDSFAPGGDESSFRKSLALRKRTFILWPVAPREIVRPVIILKAYESVIAAHQVTLRRTRLGPSSHRPQD
jgi:hypothetical protein